MDNAKILFIPVSGAKGSGEYYRSLIIANTIKEKNPNADIRFIVSRKANYAENCPFPTYQTENSPTLHTTEVNSFLSDFNPDITIFDASGRAKQLKHAKKLGSLTIFIAQHRKKIKKAFRVSRLIHTDYIWIAQPKFAVNWKPNFLNKLALALLNKPYPVFLGTIYSAPAPDIESQTLKKYGLSQKDYILINSGSGSHYLNSTTLAADLFFNIGKKLHNYKIVNVWGANYPNTLPEPSERVLSIKSLENDEFISLMKNSKFSLLSGGGSLLQAIELQVPYLSIAVAKDQQERIETVNKNIGCSFVVSTDENEIAYKVQQLIEKHTSQSASSSLNEKINGRTVAANLIQQLFQKANINEK